MSKAQSKKITFTEETDSKINGIALVLTFLGIGLFLVLYPQYFGNAIVAKVVQWIFIIIGILGLISEINKSNKSMIKGIDNFIIGIVLLIGWAICFFMWNLWYINILSLFLLMFGLYGAIRGIIEILYSLRIQKKEEGHKSSKSDIVLLITKILSFVLVVVQIYKALYVS